MHVSEGFCRQGMPGKLFSRKMQQGQYMYTVETHQEAQDRHATLPAKSFIAEITRGACIMPYFASAYMPSWLLTVVNAQELW